MGILVWDMSQRLNGSHKLPLRQPLSQHPRSVSSSGHLSTTQRNNQVHELLRCKGGPYATAQLGRRPATSMKGTTTSQARGQRVCNFMNFSPAALATQFSQFDRRGTGGLSRTELAQFLHSLGVPLSGPQLSQFVDGIASKRLHMDGVSSGSDRILLKEFLNNRAALLTADAWSCSTDPSSRSMAGSRISHTGTPPRRVSNATYAGTPDDIALGKKLLKNALATINCPGVGEASWTHYVNLNKGSQRVPPNAKVFPECLPTHAGNVSETKGLFVRYSADSLKRRKPFSYKATIPL